MKIVAMILSVALYLSPMAASAADDSLGNVCDSKAPRTYTGKVIYVVDGDTVDVVIDLGFRMQTIQRLRLAGVDTPEKNQPRFHEAKAFTENMIGNKAVTVKADKVSKYGYYLADIVIEGKSVAESLIAAGLGKPYFGGAK